VIDSAIDGSPNQLAQNLTRCGQLVSRYALVVVLAWIGFGKYVKMESRVLIEHSPLMSWIYDVFSVTTVARGLGTMEIVAALLIALRPVAASIRGRQCVGCAVVPRDDQLFVHHARGGLDSRGRPARTVGAAGPIPAQGSGVDRCRVMDAGGITVGWHLPQGI
jgi:Protein of unknown function, DUF417